MSASRSPCGQRWDRTAAKPIGCGDRRSGYGCNDEAQAFADFARSRPDNLTLLIDTYDTEAAAHKVVALAPRLKHEGIRIRAVRLDSGDLISLSRSVRRILDGGGLSDVAIFVSGGIDEDAMLEMARAGAPVDAFSYHPARKPTNFLRKASEN
jgi:nicotinic acid phosphoribosyltransferase